MCYDTGKIKLSCYMLLRVFHTFSIVRHTPRLFYLKDKTNLVLHNKITTMILFLDIS